MRVTFAHMGTLYIGLRALFGRAGVDVTVPPRTSKRTLSLGARHGPEFACLPLKVNLGNFIEALELGADTIVMAGGVGPCRFGYYGEVQRRILEAAGFRFKMVVIEPPRGRLRRVLGDLSSLFAGASPSDIAAACRLCWRKINLADWVDRAALRKRPREAVRGSTTRARTAALEVIDRASDASELADAESDARRLMNGVETRPDVNPLRIGLVGEVYVLLEPFVNLEAERVLGELGAEVTRTVYLSDWVRANVFPDLLSCLGPLVGRRRRPSAPPFLDCFVGGHGVESVRDSAEFARRGFDGVVHIGPFTCMPEIVAKAVLPGVTRRLGMPVLSLVVDEHSSEVGFLTRLEAFVDMLAFRRAKCSAGAVNARDLP